MIMKEFPSLTTEHLLLRAFQDADAAEVQRLAGNKAIAKMTQDIPHPYKDGMAETWIAGHQAEFEEGKSLIFAIILQDEDILIGTVSFTTIDQENSRASLGYWIGEPFWGKGYATEAAQEILKYGFDVLKLNRIDAEHIGSNTASRKVLQKIGMKHEGTLRQHSQMWDKVEDLELYGILAEEYFSED